MIVKVLGISGTPKKSGFTDRLLDKALEGARSVGAATEKVVLNDLVFRSCQDCGGCGTTGICILDDGMKPLYEKLASADSMILASPIFFGTVSGQLKAMIDRLQSVWIGKFVLKLPDSRRKNGIFICVGGTDKPGYFHSARKVVRMAFATLNTSYAGELFFGGYNEKRSDEKAIKEALDKAFGLGVLAGRQ